MYNGFAWIIAGSGVGLVAQNGWEWDRFAFVSVFEIFCSTLRQDLGWQISLAWAGWPWLALVGFLFRSSDGWTNTPRRIPTFDLAHPNLFCEPGTHMRMGGESFHMGIARVMGEQRLGSTQKLHTHNASLLPPTMTSTGLVLLDRKWGVCS